MRRGGSGRGAHARKEGQKGRRALCRWMAMAGITVTLAVAGVGGTAYGMTWDAAGSGEPGARAGVQAASAHDMARVSSSSAPDGSAGDFDSAASQLGIDGDLTRIQEYLDSQLNLEGGGGSVSFTALMKSLLTGDLKSVLGQAGLGLKNGLVREVHSASALLAQVVVIGMVGAVFTNFSSVFKGGQISDTGFFVTYLLLFTCLAASFFSSLEIASGVLGQVLEFMKLLMPSYFMAVAFAGGSVSAVVLYEGMTAAVTLVQWLCGSLLLPVVRIYVLLVLASHVAKEEMLTKLTELLEQGVDWALKTLVGLVLGFHVIQGMVVPYADSAGQAGVRKVIEIIPGLGQGAGAVAQMVLGSGVLIKNSLGAAAVVVLVVMTLIPIAKLVVLMLFYQLAAAVMQPVCDKRVVSCVSGVSCGHKLLLKIVVSSLLLFAIAIAITCAATNVNYYTV